MNEEFLRTVLSDEERREWEAAREEFGDDHPETFQRLNKLGMLLTPRGYAAEAEKLYREMLVRWLCITEDREDRLSVTLRYNLGVVQHAQGGSAKLDEAIINCREAHRLMEGAPPSRRTLRITYTLGRMLHEAGHLAGAEPLLREAVEGQRAVLGEDHYETRYSIARLGAVLRELGSEALLSEVRRPEPCDP